MFGWQLCCRCCVREMLPPLASCKSPAVQRLIDGSIAPVLEPPAFSTDQKGGGSSCRPYLWLSANPAASARPCLSVQRLFEGPWPTEFEEFLARCKLYNVPVTKLTAAGISTFAAACSSAAEQGGESAGSEAKGPAAGSSLAEWEAWVRSGAGLVTTGSTCVPFGMLDGSAQLRMLKGFWHKRHEVPQVAAWLARSRLV